MRRVAIVLVVAVLAGSCGQAPPTGGPGASPGRQGEAWDRDRIHTELAEVGIGVYATPDAPEPLVALAGEPAPLQLLRDQAEGFANELASQGGVLGADLNDLVSLPEGSPPFAYLVAGWLDRADTPEADKARSVIGEHDWRRPDRVVFPNLVLLLFSADVARHSADDAASAAAGPIAAKAPSNGPAAKDATLNATQNAITLARVRPPPPSHDVHLAGGTVCSGLQGWVNSVLTKFFEAIKLQGGGGVVGFIADIWNWAVELAKDVVTGLISAVGATALAAFRIAIGVVGTLSLMASMTKPWTVTLTPSPVVDHFAHPAEADHEGTFTAVVTGNAEWADYVVDCAKLADITLPDPAPAGKRVTWKTTSLSPISVASVQSSGTDQAVRDDGTAVLAYRASRESDGDPDGDLYNGGWLVQARVERLSPGDLEKLFATVVFGGTAGKLLAQLLAPLTQQVTSKLAALAVANGSQSHAIDYHLNDATPPPSGSSPKPTDEPTGAACLIGTWRLDNLTLGELLDGVLGEAAIAVVPSGDHLRTYHPGGRLDVTLDEFMIDLLMAQTTPTGPLITEFNGLFDGGGHMTYTVAVQADGSLKVSYSGSPGDLGVVVTETVKFNGEVQPGAPPPISIVKPDQLIGVTWTYHCQGRTLIEDSPGLGPVKWRRQD